MLESVSKLMRTCPPGSDFRRMHNTEEPVGTFHGKLWQRVGRGVPSDSNAMACIGEAGEVGGTQVGGKICCSLTT